MTPQYVLVKLSLIDKKGLTWESFWMEWLFSSLCEHRSFLLSSRRYFCQAFRLLVMQSSYQQTTKLWNNLLFTKEHRFVSLSITRIRAHEIEWLARFRNPRRIWLAIYCQGRTNHVTNVSVETGLPRKVGPSHFKGLPFVKKLFGKRLKRSSEILGKELMNWKSFPETNRKFFENLSVSGLPIYLWNGPLKG